MNEKEEKLIQERREQVENSFRSEGQLFSYLSFTLENFFYRYLETSRSKDLKTQELRPGVFGAYSFETMLEALKSPHPDAKKDLIELAKKDRDALLRLGLWAEVKDLSPERGKLILVSEMNWGHPDFSDPGKRIEKRVSFSYEDVTEFRKELALKLEDAARLFD